MRIAFLVFASLLLLSSCSVIRQGDIGVKRTLGKLRDKELNPGLVVYNPFISRVIKLPTRTV
ncbi:MAG TPA: hypothetical protein PK715_15410, partial [Chitinophagales bacterium]|nr:hypothetical protein [Chitinophagales bacterium]